MKSETVDYVEQLRAWTKTESRELPIEEICETLDAYDTLKSKLAEVEECLRWASKHCNEIFPCADGSWLIDNVHHAPTLYEALYTAWEGRDK